MQAVILAAGKSTRTYPLTLTKPKSLIKITGKTILEHQLDCLEGIVREVVIVVGYKKEMIMDFLKNKKYTFEIKFVEQKEQLGTGHAIQQAKDLLKDRFIVMNGDDIYHKGEIERCIKHDSCVLVKEVDDISPFGAVITENNLVKEIVEKPKEQISKYANIGLYVFNKKIFDFTLNKTERDEYEITDYVNSLAKTDKISFEIVKNYWLPVGYFQHILEANEFFLKQLKQSEIKGELEPHAIIKGNVKIGEGTLIRSGSYIEGPVVIGKNCDIGPNCYIRPCTSIGDNCRVGNAVEIKNCVIGDNVKIGHLSYFGDSILGDNINVGGGTIVANLRHDNQNIKTYVKGRLEDTGRRKFGTVIADNVKLGVKTLIYPGRKIWPNKTTLPGEIVKNDLM
jgi:bifunctional UDP-N-acetylglucosamine pyrophosphorylase/glucosamine-1-phosphate N-acetyltransferase